MYAKLLAATLLIINLIIVTVIGCAEFNYDRENSKWWFISAGIFAALLLSLFFA